MEQKDDFSKWIALLIDPATGELYQNVTKNASCAKYSTPSHGLPLTPRHLQALIMTKHTSTANYTRKGTLVQKQKSWSLWCALFRQSRPPKHLRLRGQHQRNAWELPAKRSSLHKTLLTFLCVVIMHNPHPQRPVECKGGKNPVGTQAIRNLKKKFLFHQCKSIQDLIIYRIVKWKSTLCYFLLWSVASILLLIRQDMILHLFVQLASELSKHSSLSINQPSKKAEYIHI